MLDYYAVEDQILSPYAQKSAQTKGRVRPIAPCPYRTDYQRDRDRIIHSKAFRRLKHKTQVFLSPTGDHYRTRLTHTLEVSQVARTISRALALNEDLTEAIALGHDLGHTPFGHAGERVLNRLMPGGFEHNRQSLRVVETLEDLNLTFEVRDGIVCHTGPKQADTLEGRVVRISDKIAYVNHDIDDAIRAGILHREDLPPRALQVLGETHGKRINTLVGDVIRSSDGMGEITMSPLISEVMEELHNYMYANIYSLKSAAKKEEQKAERIIEQLFGYYLEHPEKLPPSPDPAASPEQQACDFIAGMTDRYAVNEFMRLFVPAEWDR